MTNEEMSGLDDHDLDTLIAECLGIKPIEGKAIWREGSIPDYCNNWNDLMPLVDKHTLKYEVFNRGSSYLARVVLVDNSDSFVSKANTTQRALAECLLKVLRSL